MKNKENLKTLKDLPRLQLTSRRDDMIQQIVNEADSICSTELKAEAIKWVKECPHRKCTWEHLEEYPLKCSTCLMMVDFFNLTEEDLKNEQRNCFR